jgi:hypothetical protein
MGLFLFFVFLKPRFKVFGGHSKVAADLNCLRTFAFFVVEVKGPKRDVEAVSNFCIT